MNPQELAELFWKMSEIEHCVFFEHLSLISTEAERLAQFSSVANIASQRAVSVMCEIGESTIQ